MRHVLLLATLLASLFGGASTLWAQAVLVPMRHPLPRPRPITPPHSYRIDSLAIEGKIDQQVADIQVSQKFTNSGQRTIEAQFVFPLPYDGAIDSVTLMVNGKELEAELLSAEEARRRYESIVRANKDPALLEWMGTGMFQTSVFPIPPGESRTVSIHYTQLLRQADDLTDFLFPLATARYTSEPLKEFRIRLAIEAGSPIKSLYSPTHNVEIERPTKQRAIVSLNEKNIVPTEDFRLFFGTRTGAVTTNLITFRPDPKADGYFLLLASPEVQASDSERPAKTVIVVLDKSGSMSGDKIDQAREAAKFVLQNLRQGDLFNIIPYNGGVESYRPELEAVTKQSRRDAAGYIDGMFAGGSTNIHDALTTALAQLHDRNQPNFLLFLTDGRPTAGVKNEAEIARAVRDANNLRARVISFGVGYDVNSRLLDRLTRENHGLSEYVRPDEDIEAAVARVYRRISSPILTGVEMTVDFENSDTPSAINRVYPSGTFDLFEGEQLVVVGRYRGQGPATIRLTGSVDGETQTHEFAVKFPRKTRSGSHDFVEKLWATRRIGEIIDELDLNGQNEELVNELVALSTKHGILTPYTSFLADETVRPEITSVDNRMRTQRNLRQLGEASGNLGFEQRAVKQQFRNANNAPAPAASGALGGIAADAIRGGRSEALSREALQQTIRRAGGQTLYKRGKIVMTPETASIELEEDKDEIVTIERFSKEYFELIAANTPSDNQILSNQQEDEELLVRLRGQVYLIK